MINKVILVGNVGRDPEVRYLDSGVVIAKFPLATSETYTNKSGEKVTNTEWHNIVLWRKLAEVADKYVKKGSSLYIEGKIRSRSYEDKDGNKKYFTEIIADNMQMLGKKSDDRQSVPQENGNDSSYKSGNNQQSSESSESASSNSFPENLADTQTDDLPF
jgi:single-strand DNA-binding protein